MKKIKEMLFTKINYQLKIYNFKLYLNENLTFNYNNGIYIIYLMRLYHNNYYGGYAMMI